MFCEKYYKKLLNYAKKDQIWADPNCPYRGSLCPKLIDTLVCYMAFRRQVVQGSSSWQRAGALAENLAEKGA